jgi:hypothetical protein
VIEYAPLAGVVLAGDVDAGLFVEPPRWQPEFLRHGAGLCHDDAVRDEHGSDVPGNAVRVIGERHGGAAHDEQVRDDAATSEPFAESGEGALQIGAAHEEFVGVCHAAFKSWADR